MKKISRRLALAGALTAPLALAACSEKTATDDTKPSTAPAPSSDADGGVANAPAEPSPTAFPQGTFTAQNDTGAVFTIHAPADLPKDLANLNKDLKQPEWYAVSIDIDNSRGTENSGPSDVVMVDEEGQEISFESAFVVVGDASPEWDGEDHYAVGGEPVDEATYRDLNNRSVDVYNKYLEDGARPRAKSTAWYLGTEPVPEKLLYVAVIEAMQEFEAQPAK